VVSRLFALLSLFVKAQDLVHYFNMRQQHPTATITLYSQVVQDFACALASFDSSGEFLPLVADQFAARETSHRDNHPVQTSDYL
jgi:hypothetical protein